MVYLFWFIKLELDRGYSLYYLPPLRHRFHWIHWNCLPCICLPCRWGTWHGILWRVIPWNLLTYVSWGWIGVWYMIKVLISWLMKPILILDWDIWVPLVSLIPYGFHIDKVQNNLCNKSSVWLDYIDFRTRLNQFEFSKNMKTVYPD